MRPIYPGSIVQRPPFEQRYLVVQVSESTRWKEPKVRLLPGAQPPRNPTRRRRSKPFRWLWYRSSLFNIVGEDLDLLTVWEVLDA